MLMAWSTQASVNINMDDEDIEQFFLKALAQKLLENLLFLFQW